MPFIDVAVFPLGDPDFVKTGDRFCRPTLNELGDALNRFIKKQ
jgi:hypothetical protein